VVTLNFITPKGFTWNAISLQKNQCQPIARSWWGKYVDLTGELDGKIAVPGQSY